MTVVDTSAVIATLAGSPPHDPLLERLAASSELHAPHLIDLEVLHALRRLVQTGSLNDDRAADARDDFASLRITRYPHQPFVERIWELRDSVTAYDGAFIALSEALDMPLLTCDARLARSKGHRAVVELWPQPGQRRR